MSPAPHWCMSPQPTAPHRCCNLPWHATGDHAYIVKHGDVVSVVASWPGVGTKRQTGPTTVVTL